MPPEKKPGIPWFPSEGSRDPVYVSVRGQNPRSLEMKFTDQGRGGTGCLRPSFGIWSIAPPWQELGRLEIPAELVVMLRAAEGES